MDIKKCAKPSTIFLDEKDIHGRRGITSVRDRKKLSAPFAWYGGKYSHLNWILPLLPECVHYCEPFGGSAAVLINRTPSKIETYNDMCGDLVNFFRMLRTNLSTLVSEIALTPFSREEFYIAIHGSTDNISDVERARRFYVRVMQSIGAVGQTSSLGCWKSCVTSSARGMSQSCSAWTNAVGRIAAVAERMIRVQIENRPAIDVIRKYDTPDTLFYCDPPYVHEARTTSSEYSFEMSNSQHIEFAQVVNECRAMVAVSGYDCPFMDELFPATKWLKIKDIVKPTPMTHKLRQEVLWVNYDLDSLNAKISKQVNVFGTREEQETVGLDEI